MEVDKEKQARAMAKAKQSLLQAEIKREEARLNQAAAQFLQGQFDILLVDEFVQNLAEHILMLYRGDQRRKALSLLDKLEQSLCTTEVPIRERSLMVVMILSEYIYKNNIRELSSVIARIAAHWLQTETEFIAGFEPVCLKLQRIIVEMLSSEQWYEVEQLIIVINKIGRKKLIKNNLIHGVVSRVQQNLAEPSVLETLTDAYLKESSQRKDVVENILINMGQQGSRFLIERLTYCNDKDERLALVDLIPRLGTVSVPVLIGYLEDHRQPWYVTRNIILIISRLGQDRFYQNVAPHCSHEDIRVQQQVLNCIELLGGENMKERLLEALQMINDELKTHLLDLLAQFKGPEIEQALHDLWGQRDRFSSHVHDFLVAKLCRRLVVYPSAETIQALLELIEERRDRYGENDNLVRTATDALRTVEQNSSEKAVFSQNIEDNQIDSLLEDEVLAHFPVNEDDTPAGYAGGGLSDIFVETLTDTLTSKRMAEPAQEAETAFQTHLSQDHHLMIWSAFYEKLDTAEANTFFATLTPMTLEAGEDLVQQDDGLTDLIFIDHGYGDISVSGGSAQLVFAPLQAGDLIGCNGFFDGLPWPFTVTAQTRIQVRVLKRAAFAAVQSELTALSTKLESFCRLADVLPTLVRGGPHSAGAAAGQRVAVESSLTSKDQPDTAIDGDISARIAQLNGGGFNLVLPSTAVDNLSSILGHQISTELLLADDSTRTCFAFIAGGGRYDPAADDLVIHVRFYHPIADQSFSCTSICIM